MSTAGDFSICLPGRPDHRSAELQIGLGDVGQDDVGDDVVVGHVRLQFQGDTFGAWHTFYGYELGGFVQRLTQLHDRLEGTAWLADWWGVPILGITVVHRGLGIISVGGRLVAAPLDCFQPDFRFPERGSNGAFDNGISTSFGFETDQSYLPPVITGFRRFFSESGIRLEAHGGYGRRVH